MKRDKRLVATAVYKVMLVHARTLAKELCLRNPGDAAKVVKIHIRRADREHLVGMYMSANKRRPSESGESCRCGSESKGPHKFTECFFS